MGKTRTAGAWLVLAGCLALGGCAEERSPIDRVQPNYLDKQAVGDGEWYYQRTVVDVPSSNGFTFVGNTDHSGLSRVAWDIQESMLLARRTTELVEGADDKAQAGEDYKGEVVAAFRIESHFDVARQYNPTTGEELNIVVENATDRPWYERRYMRVDWSANLVTNYNLDFEAASVEPIPYFVQDEVDPQTGERVENPDAPHFDRDEQGRLEYFDITSKLFARAGTISIPGYGELPLCWMMGQETSECGAGEYAIRHSFLRIDPARQYEPLPYKGKATEVFGYFTTERLVYDPHEGIREQGRKRYLNRHNLWVDWFDEQGAPLPYDQRTLRPIVYHVNRDFPEDLKPIARDVADQWNEVFTDAVVAQGYEMLEGERAFLLCENNPVQPGDPAACGEPGSSPRLGDVRYSFMAYVPKYMEYGLLGLGPSNNDPETGEIISGMAYVYHHNNLAAYRTLEMVELLNGQRGAKDYIDGVDLTRWVEEVNRPTSERLEGRVHGLEEAEVMVDRIANGWAAKRWEGRRTNITEADVREQAEGGFGAWVRPHLEAMHELGIHNGERHAPAARLRRLEGSAIEEMLLDEEVLLGTGALAFRGQAPDDEAKRRASVVRGGFAKEVMARARAREAFAEARNMYLPEMADDALMGLARELKDAESEEAYETIRRSIYTAVLAHEVGHSLGLMHNFGGSDDAINYHDDYWKIRDDGEVGPRLTDPISDAEINAKIYDNAYSSIMDYAGRYTIDGKGVGKYDRAAILFGYAQKVEVFKEQVEPLLAQDLRDWYANSGDILRFGASGPSSVHYTSFYNRMGSKLYEAGNRVLVDVESLVLTDEATGERDWAVAEVGGQRLTRVPYIYCSHNRANLGDDCLTRDFGADSYERMKNMLDELDTWYIQRAFPRGSVGMDNWSYVSAYYPRIYDRLKRWNDLYGLYADLLPRFYSPEQMQQFLTNPATGWGAKTWAVQNGFNYLVQTVLAPDIGVYGGPYQQPDGTVLLQKFVQGANVDVDVTQGRYYATSWHDGQRECGYTWWECLHHVGFYLDKIMAIEALSDSETNFVSRSTPEDIREWEVGYYTTFPEAIDRLNRAILEGNWVEVGPYVDGDGRVRYPNYAGSMAERHSRPLDPSATFTIQLYWQVLGQARFPSLYDRSFVERSRIFLEGTGHQPTLPADQLVRFQDPISGYSFVARRFDDEAGGAAAAMLRRAQKLASLTPYCDRQSATTATEDDCPSQPIPESTARYVTAELLDHIELIKVMADLGTAMNYGNPYSP